VAKAQRLISLCEESVSGVRLYLRPGQSGSVRDQTVRCVGGRGRVSTAHLTDLFKPSCDVSIRAHL